MVRGAVDQMVYFKRTEEEIFPSGKYGLETKENVEFERSPFDQTLETQLPLRCCPV